MVLFFIVRDSASDNLCAEISLALDLMIPRQGCKVVIGDAILFT